MTDQLSMRLRRSCLVLAIAGGLFQIAASAQDRLKTMPGYQQYQKVSAESREAVTARGAQRHVER